MESQPGLSPAYVEYLDACERLAVARSDLSRRRAMEGEIAAERRHLDALAHELAREQSDVDALDSFGLRSILARLRRRLDEELTAEQADVEAVRLELAVRRQALADLNAAAGGVGVVGHEALVRDAERVHAEAQRRWEAEQIVGDSPIARRLAALDDAHAQLVARLREVDEARRAAVQAAGALGAAARELDTASGWSTYDTFFGGGFISSLVKHDRIDGAATSIAAAQQALLHLHAELADLRQPAAPVADLPSSTLRAADVWFDNLFSDWMVHSRIKASQRSVQSSLASVQETARGLDAHRLEVEAELRRMATERESLLLEPPISGWPEG